MTQDGALTERLRGGLQNLLNGFDSHTCLHKIISICSRLFLLEDIDQLWKIGIQKVIAIIKTMDNGRR